MKKTASSKNQPLLIFSLILGLVVLVIATFSWLYSSQAKDSFISAGQSVSQKVAQLPNLSLPSSQSSELKWDGQAAVSLEPTSKQIGVGDKLSISIKLQAKDLVVSGAAARFTMKFQNNLPLNPQANQMAVNPELVQNNWAYPVNRVWVDWEKKMVIGELAAFNLDTTGFSLNNSLTLATVDFIAQQPSSKIVFELDPVETVVVTKKGVPAKTEIKKSIYQVIN